MRTLAIGLSLCFALLGCADERQPVYRNTAHPGAGQVEFNRDHYQCVRENTQTRYIAVGGVFGPDQYTDDSMVAACLLARGWQVTGYR